MIVAPESDIETRDMRSYPDRRTVVAGVGAGLAVAGSLLADNAVARAKSNHVYLLSYFTDADEGRAGLKLASSTDGFVFEPLAGGRGFLVPTIGKDKLMRDPCIARGPDGLWHMVWTTNWFGSSIGHASSPDLVRWSDQQLIPAMAAFAGVRNTWAPEIIWDASKRHWVIMWSSTVAGRFGATAQASYETRFDGLSSRPYYTVTSDFRSFAPTRLLFDPGFDSIDFTWVALNDGGVRLVYKDERHGVETKRWLVSSKAASPTGPFGPASAAFTQSMTEGPTGLWMRDRYIVYYDVYEQGHFGAATTTDFDHWDDVTARVRFPPAARHGTVRQVDRRMIARIEQAAKAP